MLSFPYEADTLEHHVFVVHAHPTGDVMHRLLTACASYDRNRIHATVLVTAPWDEGRLMIKAFGPEFTELGNVYARKTVFGRARILSKYLTDIGAARVEWFAETIPWDWRIAGRLYRGQAPSSASAAFPKAEGIDPTKIVMVLKSDLSTRMAHVGQAINTAASLAREGATICIGAPLSKESFDDVLSRARVDPALRTRISHHPMKPMRRTLAYVRYWEKELRALSAAGFQTLYFRQVRIASMLLPSARRLGMRTFMEAHHPYTTWAVYQRRKMWAGSAAEESALHYHRKMARWDRALEQRVYGDLDGITCTTEAMQRHVDRLIGPGRTLLLRNGAPDPDDYATPPVSPTEGPIDLIYTGKTAQTKGTGVLVRALPLLDGVHLTIVGGPTEKDLAPYRKATAKLGVKDRVRFVTWEAQLALFERIRTARIAVHPITGEGSKEWRMYTCPLKILEYMALGTPVVATDLPAIRELVTHGENGVLVEPGSAEALAAGVRSVLDDPEYAAQLAGNARAHVRALTDSRRGALLYRFLTSGTAITNEQRSPTAMPQTPRTY